MPNLHERLIFIKNSRHILQKDIAQNIGVALRVVPAL